MTRPARTEHRWIDTIQGIFRARSAFREHEAWVDAISVEPARHVLSVDAGLAGVHFPWPTDRSADAGYRSLGGAVSDLAAVGAIPELFLMSGTLQHDDAGSPVEAFFQGMAEGAETWGIQLAGGNLSRGALGVHLTVVGRLAETAPKGRGPVRIGDDLWVTGTVGDAALGLALELDGSVDAPAAAVSALKDRFWRPEPRLRWGRELVRQDWVAGVIDVSDGWLKDLSNLLRLSGLGLRVDPRAVPRSPAWEEVVTEAPSLLGAGYWGGDDYELAFATRDVTPDAVVDWAGGVGMEIARVGTVVAEGIEWQSEPEVAPPAALGYDPYRD